ncbi:MAG: efflux transporter outer membrane subunit [Sandaracinaceae bacterium]
MRRALPLALVVGLLGCNLHPVSENPAPPIELPDQFAQSAGDEAPPETPMSDRWWEAFGDPELNHLVDEALARNYQLGAAWARLEQAESVIQAQSSASWPQISAQLDVARRRQVVVFGALGRQEFEVNSFGLSVPVSYEVDLWNRVGHSVAAAGFDALASRDDVEALALTLVANVVEAWLGLLQQRSLNALIGEQHHTNEIYAELVQLRFEHGLGTALDVYQQQQRTRATAAQLAQAQGNEEVARQQLAVLTGRMPGAFRGQIGQLPEPTHMPAVPALPPTGIPADLLLRRPDVRAARRRVTAQDHRVGAAIADQLPRFNFQASIGLSSPSVEDLLSSFVWSLASSLLAPVLDGGRRAAEVRRNRAALRERVQTFAQTLLTAMLEVENALAQERQIAVQITHLDGQLEATRATLNEAQRRYREGLSDYLPVLTALSSVQGIEQQRLATERQFLSQRVQLARALGGTWTVDLEPPRLPEPQGEDEREEEEPEADDAPDADETEAT